MGNETTIRKIVVTPHPLELAVTQADLDALRDAKQRVGNYSQTKKVTTLTNGKIIIQTTQPDKYKTLL